MVARPAVAVPDGGSPCLSPANPAFSLLFCPHPPNPLPLRGRGRPRLFHARGFAPCIPGAGRGAARAEPAEQAPVGGIPPTLAARPAVAVPDGGLPSLPPADSAVSLLCFPLSPAPFPGGEGGDFSFLMQGASPLASPGLDGARHRYCLWKTGSFGFKWCVGTRWGGGNPGCKKPPPGVHLYTGSVSAVGGSVQGCRGRSPRQNKLWAPPSRREGGQGDGGKKAS